MNAFNRERLRLSVSVLLHALDQRWVHFLLIVSVMTFAAIRFSKLSFAQHFDLAVQDQYFNNRGPATPIEIAEKLPETKNIVILRAEHILPRHVMALLLKQLRQAKVVLLDMTLGSRSAELLKNEQAFYTDISPQWAAEDAELGHAIAQAGNVVVGAWQSELARPDLKDPGAVVRKLGWQLPSATIWDKARYHGHLGIIPDQQADGVVRRVRLFERVNGHEVPCVGLAAAAALLGVPQSKLSEGRAAGDHVELGTRRIPVDSNGTMLINYFGDRNSFENGSNSNCIAYQSVLGGLTDPSDFAGKIVIVGVASDQSRDMVDTPFNMTAGMLVQANIIATLLSSNGPPVLMAGRVTAIIVIAASLLVVIALLFLPIWSVLILAVVEGASLILIGDHLFRQANIVMGLSAPFMSILFTFNAVGLYEYRRARQTLGRFVGQEMVPHALHLFGRLDVGGREVCASAFYCDVRGYSTLAEHMKPRDINALVNAYTEALVAVVKKHGGRPITYQGDGAFVLFEGTVGGIDHAERAVRAAIELQSRFVGLRRDRISNGGSPMKIGIGIETGQMFVGLMGATERVHFNAVGDAVNVAARVQGLTQECGHGVLITRNTYDLVKDAIYAVPCGKYALKGREQTVEIYGVPHTGDESESKREQRDHQIQPRGDESARFAVWHEPSGKRIDAVPTGSASGPRI